MCEIKNIEKELQPCDICLSGECASCEHFEMDDDVDENFEDDDNDLQ